jgi:hypothetical protein
MEYGKTAIRIVRAGGDELTPDEAGSGSYVFTAGFDADIVYAFEKENAEREVEDWARRHGVSDRLKRANKVIEQLPEDPSAEFDFEAELEDGKKVNARLQALSEELNIPVGTPGFLDIAHDRGIIESVMLYRNAAFGAPWWHVSRSIPDVAQVTGWAAGARGCETRGFTAVYIYEHANYGPNRFLPSVRLAGGRRIDVTPSAIGSVLFI